MSGTLYPFPAEFMEAGGCRYEWENGEQFNWQSSVHVLHEYASELFVRS